MTPQAIAYWRITAKLTSVCYISSSGSSCNAAYSFVFSLVEAHG
jgi:hypothetical protein